MQRLNTATRARNAAAWIVALVLVATSCGSAARPTVTGDRIDETTTSAQTEPAIATPGTSSDGAGADGSQDGGSQDGGSPDGSSPDSGEAASGTAPVTPTETADASTEVEQLTVEVIETFPHDPQAFTQGLELHDGRFIESTGALNGNSELRWVDPATGEVLQNVTIASEYFAEGVTKVDNQLIQLTWQNNTAFYWNATTLEPIKEVSYPGEGWGLCFDGARLVMTDGTPVLIFRDPASFDEIGRVDVTLNGEPVYNLNEIECVDGQVWANIWLTELIVRIDPITGRVNAVVDAIALEGPQTGDSNAVLNGIAWDVFTQSFYVTGKNWPTMYRVNFVPSPSG